MRNRFQTLRVAVTMMGSLLFVFALILLTPVILVLVDGEFLRQERTLLAFLVPAAAAGVAGVLARRWKSSDGPDRRQAALVCALAWVVFSALGALPYVIGIRASFLDAYFETMSGFTTTGITMFSGLDAMPRSVLFWRSLEESFRSVRFQVISILTTTGFGTRDIGAPYFGAVARQLLLSMMVIGGWVGSAGGGVKVLREGGCPPGG